MAEWVEQQRATWSVILALSIWGILGETAAASAKLVGLLEQGGYLITNSSAVLAERECIEEEIDRERQNYIDAGLSVDIEQLELSPPGTFSLASRRQPEDATWKKSRRKLQEELDESWSFSVLWRFRRHQ